MFSECRMLRKAKKYAKFGVTASPLNLRRQPPDSAKPSAFRLLLLEISKHLGKEDAENFKAFLKDYVQENDKGAMTVKQLQEATTTYCVLMGSAKVGCIQPDDLSNLEDFLNESGHNVLVQEIKDFQKEEQGGNA